MLLSSSKSRSTALQLYPEGHDTGWREQELGALQHTYQKKLRFSDAAFLCILSGAWSLQVMRGRRIRGQGAISGDDLYASRMFFGLYDVI
jgi:hypothetical protein